MIEDKLLLLGCSLAEGFLIALAFTLSVIFAEMIFHNKDDNALLKIIYSIIGFSIGLAIFLNVQLTIGV